MNTLSTGFDLVLKDRKMDISTIVHGFLQFFRHERAKNLHMIGITCLKDTTETKMSLLIVFRSISFCYMGHHFNIQGIQYTYNVIQRCVRVTIVAVEK